MANEKTKTSRTGLMLGKQLLEILWEKESRPSLQWLRQHTGKDVPGVRIGRLIYYSPEKVKSALGI